MKSFQILPVLAVLVALVTLSQADNYCLNKVESDCASFKNRISCNANYGNFDKVEAEFNNLFNKYLTRSFEYLMISTNFDNYELARPGFTSIFEQMSDNKWDTAVRIIKYMTDRHGVVKFAPSDARIDGEYELFEIEAIAKAIDMEKEFAIDANRIHQIASSPQAKKHDIDVCRKIAKKFAFQQSGIVRQFVGYETELTKMSDSLNLAISLNQFDDVLQGETV